jgi:hypothetical protein
MNASTRGTTWRAVLTLWLGLSIAAPSLARPADVPPLLDGTFIQLTEGHGGWTTAQWEDLFRELRRLRLTRVVVQWSLAGDLAFYESAAHRKVANPPLETILRLAEESHMTVLVGLAHDPEYWGRIAREPAIVEAYLRRLRSRSLSVARELAPRLGRSAAFSGWYLSEEIDDLNWLEPRRRAILAAHLKEEAQGLRELAPAGTIAVSGYSRANCDPTALAGLWKDLLADSPLDLVLFQDGIGALNLDLEHWPLYLEALRGAVRERGKELGVVVEVFQQTGGPPLDEGTFRAEAAPLDRVRRQLATAGLHVAGRYAFSVPDYMRPSLGPRSAELFEGYLRLVEAPP